MYLWKVSFSELQGLFHNGCFVYDLFFVYY